jgi:hypothetical protein
MPSVEHGDGPSDFIKHGIALTGQEAMELLNLLVGLLENFKAVTFESSWRLVSRICNCAGKTFTETTNKCLY